MNERPKLTAAHRALGLTGYESKMERYADQIESEIKALKQSDCISNVSGICKSTRVSDSGVLSGCGVEYAPRSGFKYCPYCGNKLELIF